ncbi:aminotransferase class III-fold pyridoxal phosphate-dependent enzyme [Streptosporangium sp. NPDC051023]|uniref:aspartate aminotransferase family protein n=1 Tax=Streptosporangium sp. NPDC051023 TaxID=3155410 RepID=UPI00344C32B4
MRTHRQVLAESKAAHNHPTYSKMAFVMGCGVQGQGSGSSVLDEDGRSFLALFDQYGNQSFGYSNERLIAVLRDQLDLGILNSTKIMFEEVQIRLTERLAELTGHRLPFAYLANGGGETIDNALKLARATTGRRTFISARGCFHGKTFATLSASARPEHEALFGPFLERFELVDFGDVEQLAAAIDGETAAVLLEPVQAEAGVIVPPPDYLREVRRLCDENGALLILDEMQTAFGRCGTFFAHQQFGVTPDIICIGKAFGGGMLPISAVLGTEAVWETLRALPSTFGSSLGGNPLSCRVGLESIAIATEEAFLAGVEEKARVIGDRLARAVGRFPELIAAHRGLGMMHGLEFHDDSIAGLVLGGLLAAGVTSTYSLYNTKVLRIQPPMVISEADLERGLESLEAVLTEAAAHRRRLDRLEAAVSPLSRRVRSVHSAEQVLDLLHRRPHLLDPFAMDPEADVTTPAEEEFSGTLGDDLVVWADRSQRLADGVVLRAAPCWLWASLERSVRVRRLDEGDGCEVEIRIVWDTGSGGYESMVGGRIGFFVTQRLADLVVDLERALEKESGHEASRTR